MMETLKQLEQLTMIMVDIDLENRDILQESSNKLDMVLQHIRQLEQKIQSHESLQDSWWQQLQSLGLWGERMAHMR